MPRVLSTGDPVRVGDRQSIALDYLHRTAEQMEQAVRNRAAYAKLGREYGLTNQAIGTALGITEARVRQIVAGS
jgi:DNA-directed RNA polymerase sigma subunit (sigma70/sigma32)